MDEEPKMRTKPQPMPLMQAMAAALAPPDGPPPRKRERTRRQLLEAAIRLLAEKGIAATTVPDIAVAAGMTTATVYNHFRTKAEIVEAVAIAISQGFRAASAESRAALKLGAERMAAGCHRYLRLAELSPDWAMLVLDVAAASARYAETMDSFILAELRAGVREKSFRIESEAAAMDLINGTVMRAMRLIARGEAPAGHRMAVVVTVLSGLGMPTARARKIASLKLAPFPT
jgi:AcrR family transcriptional regulator